MEGWTGSEEESSGGEWGVWLRGGHARVLLGPVRSWDLLLSPKGSLWRTWAKWQHGRVLLRW